MKIVCEVSLGELIDKLTILTIKTERIGDAVKRDLAQKEAMSLSKTLSELALSGVDNFFNRLKVVNEALWDIEDEIRLLERDQDFGEQFVRLARAVYQTNDQRFEIKNEINHHFGSGIKEVKSYEKY
jgi:dsDNA-specific endonuclease/ATPase MutS2